MLHERTRGKRDVNLSVHPAVLCEGLSAAGHESCSFAHLPGGQSGRTHIASGAALLGLRPAYCLARQVGHLHDGSGITMQLSLKAEMPSCKGLPTPLFMPGIYRLQSHTVWLPSSFKKLAKRGYLRDLKCQTKYELTVTLNSASALQTATGAGKMGTLMTDHAPSGLHSITGR